MKTKEELNAIREEAKKMSRKLAELTEDELQEVAGGLIIRNPDGTYTVVDNDGGWIGPRYDNPDEALRKMKEFEGSL